MDRMQTGHPTCDSLISDNLVPFSTEVSSMSAVPRPFPAVERGELTFKDFAGDKSSTFQTTLLFVNVLSLKCSTR